MADQTSRGGKKVGTGQQEDSEKHQGVREGEGAPEGVAQRPAEGQPGGPKPNQGHTRPQKD